MSDASHRPHSSHEPLPTAAPQLTIEVQQLAAHPLLDQVSAIGLFLQDPKQVQLFIQTIKVFVLGNRPAAKVFSGPLVPLVGDAPIRVSASGWAVICCW